MEDTEDHKEEFPLPSPKRRRLSQDSEISTDNHSLQPDVAQEEQKGEPQEEQPTLPVDTVETKQEDNQEEPPLPAALPRPNDQPPSSPHLHPASAHIRDSSAADTPYSTDADPASSPAPRPRNVTPPPRQTSDLHYKPSLILHGHKKAVSAVSYSPDGQFIASASADATIKIWDSTTGKHLHTLRGHIAGISTLAWSPSRASSSIAGAGSESLVLASGGDDKAIRLWRVTSGFAKAHRTPLTAHHNYILSLAFSPKGNILVSGSTDEAVILWDVRTCRPMRILPAHGDPVHGVDFSSDGTLVVSCSSDGLIRIWDTQSGQCLRTFFHEEVGGGRPGVLGIKFTPNARYVAAWTGDSVVRLWDYVGGRDAGGGRARCVKTYQSDGFKVARYSLFGAFGSYVVDRTAERDDVMDMPILDDQTDGVEDMERRVEKLEEEKREQEDMLQEQTKAFLVSGSEDGGIILWDVVSKEVMQRLNEDNSGKRGHNGVVFGVDTHPSRKEIVSCGQDKTVRIWRSAE